MAFLHIYATPLLLKQSEKRTGPGLVLTQSGIKFAYNSEEIVTRPSPIRMVQ